MKIRLVDNEKIYFADAQMIKGVLWVHYDGKTFIYESETQKRKARVKSSQTATGTLTSPMPGKITKIHKQEGDAVKAGEAILVMEAMKMEYTLKADISGVLGKVDCKVGEQVALGKKLVVII